MEISRSFTAKITDRVYITNYSNSEGDRQLCCFIEDGETISLSFGADSTQKLTETIQNLQQIYQILCERRQLQIKKELDSIPKIPAFSINEYDEIGF
ncbi:MAG: hypothetical protein PUP93_25105 [Rhizonema sp. NSF051]|nr:hypothetical protein [Rhizonema sp. NSF051]